MDGVSLGSIYVRAKDLFEFCLNVLKSLGVKESDAKIIAENLVLANLRGVDSHGVARLPVYAERVIKGLIDPHGSLEIIKDYGAIALINANNNFGQVAAMKAVSVAVEKAKKFGVAAVGVRNANHFGMAAHYAVKLCEQKLIGIVLANGPPALAPWGGKIPLLGTNPICVGLPVDDKDSIILDMAVSVVARGKIRLAALKGEKIPEGWAFDADGNPTTDPKAALKGTLAPIGGPKGYGLALVVDILCGLLTSSNYLRNVKALNDFSGPCGTGFFIGAIDIEPFISYEKYKELMTDYVKEIKKCPKKNQINEIFLPGEPEKREMEKREKFGIPLDEEVLVILKHLAKKLKINFTL